MIARYLNPGHVSVVMGPPTRPYTAKKRSLRNHPVPPWFHDAKFGIFIHWGLYSVPAFAPVDRADVTVADLLLSEGEEAAYSHQPYAEWYQNSIRIPGSPARAYHDEHYGPAFAYEDFQEAFDKGLAGWDPDAWAELFHAAGAKYVVLVTKHHDGFLLWPSAHPNPRAPDYRAARDVAGELARAVTARDMRMGFYYSSLLDWSFTPEPIRSFIDLVTLSPVDETYAAYCDAHWRELIARYQPDILWSDIGYPPKGRLFEILATFYNATPEGVVNDRWIRVPGLARKFLRSKVGRKIVNFFVRRAVQKEGISTPTPAVYDFTTPEYATLPETVPYKWETTRGCGQSFAYNRVEPLENYLTLPDLVTMFVDVVSKNGNLLLNVGPRADGTIPEVQRDLLLAFGQWLAVHGPAIYGTRPWTRAGGSTGSGDPVRFTWKDPHLYAFLLAPPRDPANSAGVVLRELGDAPLVPGSPARLLGWDEPLAWTRDGANLRVPWTLPAPLPAKLGKSPAWALAFELARPPPA